MPHCSGERDDERRCDGCDECAAELGEKFALTPTPREGKKQRDEPTNRKRKEHLRNSAAEKARGASAKERVAEYQHIHRRMTQARGKTLEFRERCVGVDRAREEALRGFERLLKH